MNRQDVIDLIQRNNKEISKNLYDRADAETRKGNREAGDAIRQVASELAWYRVQ